MIRWGIGILPICTYDVYNRITPPRYVCCTSCLIRPTEYFGNSNCHQITFDDSKCSYKVASHDHHPHSPSSRSGFAHSAFTFAYESQITKSSVSEAQARGQSRTQLLLAHPHPAVSGCIECLQRSVEIVAGFMETCSHQFGISNRFRSGLASCYSLIKVSWEIVVNIMAAIQGVLVKSVSLSFFLPLSLSRSFHIVLVPYFRSTASGGTGHANNVPAERAGLRRHRGAPQRGN